MTVLPVLLLVSACDPAPALEGRRHFETGNFAAAEVEFRQAVEQDCGSAQSVADRINLAATLRERDAAAEAKAVLLGVAEPARLPLELRISYWNCLALVEEQSGHVAAADAAFRRALAELTTSAPARLAIQVLTNFARNRMKQGDLREAEEALRKARELPGWQHQRLLSSDLNLAELRRMQGRRREAEAILRELLERREGVPVQTRGAIANNLASLAAARGAHREAEAMWAEAIRMFRTAYGERHPIVAKALNNLAAHYVERKRFGDAERLYLEAVDMQEEPQVLNNLAALYQRQRRMAEAETLYRRALRIGNRPGRTSISLTGNLATLLAQTGRAEESIECFQALLPLLALAVPADEPMVARYLESYETLLRRRREPAEAERVAALAMKYRVRAALRQED